MKTYDLTVLSNIKVSERYWHLTLDSSNIPEKIEPGQFFNFKCSADMNPFLRRPLSIYKINQRTLEFLYLVKGVGTQNLTQFKTGDKINVFGPLGKGFTIRPEWSGILLLARGVGIATLTAVAQSAAERGVKCIAILSARTQNDLLATEALKSLGTEVFKVTDEEGTSGVENVQQLVELILMNETIDYVYTCGSKRLSQMLQATARRRNIPGEIALEEHMGCAMGVCFACVCELQEENSIRSVRVCKEGPVFAIDKVVI